MEDSLKMIQMPDGRYKIEWDKNHPRYLFLNSLTEDQINVMLESSFKDLVNRHEF